MDAEADVHVDHRVPCQRRNPILRSKQTLGNESWRNSSDERGTLYMLTPQLWRVALGGQFKAHWSRIGGVGWRDPGGERRGEAYTHQTHHPLTDCLCLTGDCTGRGPSEVRAWDRGEREEGNVWAMTMRRILGNSSESRGQSIVYISALA